MVCVLTRCYLIFTSFSGKHSIRLWSCRIQLTFEGVEWFLYNRTAAYDNILEQIEKVSRPTSRSSSYHRLFRRFSRQGNDTFALVLPYSSFTVFKAIHPFYMLPLLSDPPFMFPIQSSERWIGQRTSYPHSILKTFYHLGSIYEPVQLFWAIPPLPIYLYPNFRARRGRLELLRSVVLFMVLSFN